MLRRRMPHGAAAALPGWACRTDGGLARLAPHVHLDVHHVERKALGAGVVVQACKARAARHELLRQRRPEPVGKALCLTFVKDQVAGLQLHFARHTGGQRVKLHARRRPRCATAGAVLAPAFPGSACLSSRLWSLAHLVALVSRAKAKAQLRCHPAHHLRFAAHQGALCVLSFSRHPWPLPLALPRASIGLTLRTKPQQSRKRGSEPSCLPDSVQPSQRQVPLASSGT